MMKKATKVKVVNPKTIKYVNEDTNQVKKFIYILLGVAAIAILLYFVTARYILKDGFQNEEEIKDITINYDQVKVGTVFNRPEIEYYVFAYDSEKNSSVYYDAVKNKYSKSIKMYYLDLSNPINKKYIGEKSNKNATKPEELSIKEPTLMHIKNGAIADYYDDIETIKEKLK